MLCPTLTLRTAALGCRLQTTLLAPCTFHKAAAPPLRIQETSSPKSKYHRRVSTSKHQVSFKKSLAVTSRSASTMSNPHPSSTQNTSTQNPNTTDLALDWNTFFQLRQSRRWWQLGSSVSTSVTGFILGMQAITAADMDSLLSQIPLDPFITMGLLTFTCGGIGWLAGPFLGTALFNVRNRNYKKQIEEKEREFYRRIKKWRVDPAGASVANPVPDYYGEKIGSVAGYRQWLNDQRAFNRKRQNYV